MSFLVCQDGCFNVKNVSTIRRSSNGKGYSVAVTGKDGAFSHWSDISTESYQEIVSNIAATTRVRELEARIQQLEFQIFYAPGGPGYLQAKEHFEAQTK